MTPYKAPLRDIRFVTQELLNYEKHYQSLPDCDEVNLELFDSILDEIARFTEEVVAPLNAVGDQVGCELQENGEVETPPGFKEAYQQYVEGGWPTLDQPRSIRWSGLADVDRLADARDERHRKLVMVHVRRTVSRRHGDHQRARFGRTEGTVHGTAGQRPMDRHDVSHRSALRHGSRSAQDQSRADAGRRLQDHGLEDFHLLGRTRYGREHCAYRAGPARGLTAGHQGHLVVHRPEVLVQ